VLVKGIITPKIKILSSFTHQKVVPNLNVFLLNAKTILGPIDFPRKNKYYGSQWLPSTVVRKTQWI